MTNDKIISVEQIMRDRSDLRTLDEFGQEIKNMGTPDLFFIAEAKDSENIRNEILNLCDDERIKYLIQQKKTKIFFEKRQNDIIGFLLFSEINDDFNSLIIHEVCIKERNFKQFFKLFKKVFADSFFIYTDTKNEGTKKMLQKHKFEKNKMQDFSLVLKR